MIGIREISGSHAMRFRKRVIAFTVEHALIHVHIEQIRATADLVERNLESLVVVVGCDELSKTCGARHVRPLADHLKIRIGPNDEGFEARVVGVQ